MIRIIDSHVHFRDCREAYKQTIEGGLRMAAQVGIIAVGDMPNTDPPVLGLKDVLVRLGLASKSKLPVKYFTWVGLTADTFQIKDAAEAVCKVPEALGLKLYAGQSVGGLGVTRPEDQKKVYQQLVELNYSGVVATHCEKMSCLMSALWNPQNPWTHGLSRPPLAEVEAIEDQIAFAVLSGFKGRLHICHVSCLESLELIMEAKKAGLDISCEVTPHHILLNDGLLLKDGGLIWKVNPPLRSEKVQKELAIAFLQLVRKQADWIFVATDYTPHMLAEKLGPPYLSGIADYTLYEKLLEWFKRERLSDEEIEQVTYHNQKRIFGGKLKDV